MLLAGIAGMVTPGKSGVSGRVLGAIIVVVVGFVIWKSVTLRVEVTRETIVRYEFWRKVVSWAEVQTLEVVRRDEVTPWYTVRIVTAGGRRVRLPPLTGLKGYAERVAEDLWSLRPK